MEVRKGREELSDADDLEIVTGISVLGSFGALVAGMVYLILPRLKRRESCTERNGGLQMSHTKSLRWKAVAVGVPSKKNLCGFA